MITAMGLLLFAGIQSLGGLDNTIGQMQTVDGFLDWFPKDLALPGATGGILFAASWLFAGLSVIGQPHIMVRFMTLEDSGKMNRARLWYYLWFTAFYALATGVGRLADTQLFGVDNPRSLDATRRTPFTDKIDYDRYNRMRPGTGNGQ